jgi:hypothetical protein
MFFGRTENFGGEKVINMRTEKCSETQNFQNGSKTNFGDFWTFFWTFLDIFAKITQLKMSKWVILFS